MKSFHFILALIFISINTWAQEEGEWVTYYGELHGYQISFPENWATGAEEKDHTIGKSGFILSYDPTNENFPNGIVQVLATAGSLKSTMKIYRNIFHKNAKKSEDQNFKWVGEGEAELEDGRKYGWNEYVHTMDLNDGSSYIKHVKEYYIKKTYGLTKYNIRIVLTSKEHYWEEIKPTMDQIWASFEFYEP